MAARRARRLPRGRLASWSPTTTSASTAPATPRPGRPELSIGPRLLAVCDVFDALTDDRVYRSAWEIEDALALLRSEAGTKLDAACVHALEQVVLGVRTATVRSAAWSPAVSPA